MQEHIWLFVATKKLAHYFVSQHMYICLDVGVVDRAVDSPLFQWVLARMLCRYFLIAK